MMGWFQYIGGAFLGWSLGANNSGNVFGTAVASGMVKYRLAIWLVAAFVALGAILQGGPGIETLSRNLRKQKPADTDYHAEIAPRKNNALKFAVATSMAAAITVTALTILKLPASASQAIVGAIAGVGLLRGDADWAGLGKVLLCWIGTPIGGMLFTILFYWIFKKILGKWRPSVFEYDPVVRLGLIICGCYGAYALGANNVANVAAVFVGKDMLTVQQAAVFGAVCIALGAVTYSKPVMTTVGKGIVELDAFSAFVCVLSQGVAMYIFALLGVPVSSSQAIVGAAMGIGLIKGVQTVNFKTLAHVAAGWTATPLAAGILAAAAYAAANLKYVP
jgi:PiT family inorganic phosphate transporter